MNAGGLPIGVVLTPGQAHDVTAYPTLMAERDSDPGALLADKGYDSDAIRQDLRDRGAAPEIPTKRSRRVGFPSTSRSMPYARASSAALVISKRCAVLPRATTKQRRVFWDSSCWAVCGSGSGLSTGPNPPAKLV